MNTLFKGLILVSLIIYTSSLNCPRDSSKWCSTVEIAKLCEVFDQCVKHVWKPANPFIQINSLQNDDLVNLTLYYETLCPDSKAFINGQLWNAFENISSIMNLTLVPYGNAQEKWNIETKLWQYTCQHGGEECLGNVIQTCMIYNRTKTEGHFPFIYCMESNNDDDIITAAKKCGVQLNITLDSVFECATNKFGNNLEHLMAVQTNNLNPAHTYVPWVTLNGVHTEQIQQEAQTDLIGLICSTYTGSNKPPACTK